MFQTQGISDLQVESNEQMIISAYLNTYKNEKVAIYILYNFLLALEFAPVKKPRYPGLKSIRKRGMI